MRALHAPSEKSFTADLPSASPITFPRRSVTAGRFTILPSLQPSHSGIPSAPRLVFSVYAVPVGLSNLKSQISNPLFSFATFALLPSHELPLSCSALLAKRSGSFVVLASACQVHFAFCFVSPCPSILSISPLNTESLELKTFPFCTLNSQLCTALNTLLQQGGYALERSFPQPFQRFSWLSAGQVRVCPYLSIPSMPVHFPAEP